jgi:hypothetical protein
MSVGDGMSDDVSVMVGVLVRVGVSVGVSVTVGVRVRVEVLVSVGGIVRVRLGNGLAVGTSVLVLTCTTSDAGIVAANCVCSASV